MCNLKLHHILFLVYTFWTYFYPGFGLLSILQLYEKYLNSSEGKEYVRRKLKCVSALKWPEPLLRFLMTVVYKFEIFEIVVIFCFYMVVRIGWKWENARRKGYQGVIELLRKQHENSPKLEDYPPPHSWIFKKLSHSHPPLLLYANEWIMVAHTVAVGQNGKYSKL